MYRRYYSVNDMPQMQTKGKCEPKKEECADNIHIEKKNQTGNIGSFFKNLETDDIILIAIALLLLADDCDDKMLLVAIAFIFISGIL